MGKYLTPVVEVFQDVLRMRIHMCGLFLKKSILGLLWLVHNLQFWLTVLIHVLESRFTKRVPESDSNASSSRDIETGDSSLLHSCYLGMARFCFRLTQLSYLAFLSVYVCLGFKEPVPLAILKDKQD